MEDTACLQGQEKDFSILYSASESLCHIKIVLECGQLFVSPQIQDQRIFTSWGGIVIWEGCDCEAERSGFETLCGHLNSVYH